MTGAIVIAVLSHKGGTGKSSVVFELATALSNEKKVVVLDADSQGTSTSFLASVQSDSLRVLPFSGENMKSALSSAGIVFIDCPPALQRSSYDAVSVADFIISPVEADANAQDAINDVQKIVFESKSTAKLLAIVINRIQRSKFSAMMVDVITKKAEALGVPVVPIRNSSAVSVSQAAGLNILKMEKNPAQEGFQKLIEIVREKR